MEKIAWNTFQELPGIVEKCKLFRDQDNIIKRPTKEQQGNLSNSSPPDKGRSLEDVIQDTEEILSYRFSTGHPRFFSFVPAPASPLSWLGDAITTAFNIYAGSSESGAGVSAIENSIIRWVAERFGMPPSAGGQFVSGASIACLTALIVARDQLVEDDMRTKAVAYLSDETHFCVAKGLRITGLLEHQIRTVPCNAKFQMDPDNLRSTIAQDIKDGLKPYVVVATCGTTSTGSIDPMDTIADIAKEHNMWMHVDAAYGGSVAFCESKRNLLQGLGRADSIAWDPHKWLFQLLGCSLVVFKEKSLPAKSFAAGAHFLRDLEDGGNQNPYNYGIELSRPARHMKLWFSLQILGTDMIDQMISRGFELADLVESEIRKLADWEIVTPNALAVLNFRFNPKGMNADNVNKINELVSKEMSDQNIAVAFTTCINGVVCLRMCTINPRTTDNDIRDVIKALDQNARVISRRFPRTGPGLDDREKGYAAMKDRLLCSNRESGVLPG
ncbi:pyridoxal-dependent decarboxylase [Aspergillus sclerotioniger CBS 115572]|uniref:Pyridoxal-dependent decarboxylase n=1 Tax=Aspergillus sclerotioniger CBS 115572 TaxID=1450535 RepID=A0A317XEG1_9EURO|nr:pyridoxal-dependent decarboxylase [Aspergillus sclerotioniger CBS 115572]PWY96725.1 pyridoxal-dependent decarboxylase [Aspergillus sclerotioniger CBS 115572]